MKGCLPAYLHKATKFWNNYSVVWIIELLKNCIRLAGNSASGQLNFRVKTLVCWFKFWLAVWKYELPYQIKVEYMFQKLWTTFSNCNYWMTATIFRFGSWWLNSYLIFKGYCVERTPLWQCINSKRNTVKLTGKFIWRFCSEAKQWKDWSKM